MYIYILFSPVKPEAGNNSVWKKIYAHLNFPGKELNVIDIKGIYIYIYIYRERERFERVRVGVCVCVC